VKQTEVDFELQMALEQPLLVHTSLMICLRPMCLTHPVSNPPTITNVLVLKPRMQANKCFVA
jgi:hypothetical protein